MPDIPEVPDGWTLKTLPGWPTHWFANWGTLERAGNVLLPRNFAAIIEADDRSDTVFLCYAVFEGQVKLSCITSSASDVPTGLDRIRRAAPMATWTRLAIVKMALFIATADPDKLEEEGRQFAREVGDSSIGANWADMARSWGLQLRDDADANVEHAKTHPVRRKRNRITREHLEEVAGVYRKADAAGEPPTRAVQSRWSTTHSTAAKWVSKAREEGILGPPAGFRGGEVGSFAARAAVRPIAEAAAKPLSNRIGKVVADSMRQAAEGGEDEE